MGSYNWMKGKFDLRKVKKGDRLLIGLVNDIISPGS